MLSADWPIIQNFDIKTCNRRSPCPKHYFVKSTPAVETVAGGAELLEAENLEGERQRWLLTVGLVIILVGSLATYGVLRKRHRRKQRLLHTQLMEEQLAHKADKETLGKDLYDQKMEMARLRGVLTNKKQKGLRDKLIQEENLQKAGDIIDGQKEELDSLRRKFAVMKREKRDLEKELEESVKQQKRLEADNWRLDHGMSVKERIEYFRQRGTDAATLSLLRWLKSGVLEYGRTYDFDQIQGQLIALLDAECPGMSGRIQSCTTNVTKRTICYLIALGLDDETMHCRATPNVSDKTVRNYHRECRELVIRELESSES